MPRKFEKFRILIEIMFSNSQAFVIRQIFFKKLNKTILMFMNLREYVQN